jgi:hypothetical protein
MLTEVSDNLMEVSDNFLEVSDNRKSPTTRRNSPMMEVSNNQSLRRLVDFRLFLLHCLSSHNKRLHVHLALRSSLWDPHHILAL